MTNYQWNPTDYEKNSSQQQLWARELIAKLNLQGDEKVLDVGCGDGKVTAEIAGRLPHGSVLGIDKSGEMIALAQQRHGVDTHPNLHFQVADASHLPFHGEFSLVFSNAALHWVRDHRPVLQGIARSLQPGGRILLQMGGQGNAVHIIAAIDEQMALDPYAPYFADFFFPFGFHGPDEYALWMGEAGSEAAARRVNPQGYGPQWAERAERLAAHHPFAAVYPVPARSAARTFHRSGSRSLPGTVSFR